MRNWYRASLYCALIPFFIGLAIYIAWYLSRAGWLELAGVYNIWLGLLLFGLGLGCLVVYVVKARRSGAPRYWKRAGVALMLLLVNFPFTMILLSSVFYQMGTSTLIIDNQTSSVISQLSLTQREKVYSLDDVAPNSRLKEDFHFPYEGSVDYAFELDGVRQSGIAFGYVTFWLGSAVEMKVLAPGIISTNTRK